MTSTDPIAKPGSSPVDSAPDLLFEDEDDSTSGHIHDNGKAAHTHIHDEKSLRQLVNRFSLIEGHIRGIKSMVLESEPCPDVLIQIAGVRGALDRVARLILDEHLTQCIARAAQAGDIEGEIKELKDALDRFMPGKPPKKKKPKKKKLVVDAGE